MNLKIAIAAVLFAAVSNAQTTCEILMPSGSSTGILVNVDSDSVFSVSLKAGDLITLGVAALCETDAISIDSVDVDADTASVACVDGALHNVMISCK